MKPSDKIKKLKSFLDTLETTCEYDELITIESVDIVSHFDSEGKVELENPYIKVYLSKHEYTNIMFSALIRINNDDVVVSTNAFVKPRHRITEMVDKELEIGKRWSKDSMICVLKTLLKDQ